ncbi:serine-rich adhesin for platelets [Uranotaenia lowii]|uniref:serine-rich adhesin for platelets n=1 Tax=Uranotaenia lowii TaxID=190385 RepID=UPI0024784892|nr:serine-rich adhesin for platelets [Uranotaenia lowii]XP_055587309.1 serine-rich adhesin for platelets [Uranotaenia lowii]XP_055587310.1 serine-rich adhesin for platelets [Uranotaenia lowii]XP_055587311.1 serine-rich adhesin for platelets [Uranotaenia lowii]XP_055587313.1 serine-rich adhesin for platelets [Uranotaenia lowii]
MNIDPSSNTDNSDKSVSTNTTTPSVSATNVCTEEDEESTLVEVSPSSSSSPTTVSSFSPSTRSCSTGEDVVESNSNVSFEAGLMPTAAMTENSATCLTDSVVSSEASTVALIEGVTTNQHTQQSLLVPQEVAEQDVNVVNSRNLPIQSSSSLSTPSSSEEYDAESATTINTKEPLNQTSAIIKNNLNDSCSEAATSGQPKYPIPSGSGNRSLLPESIGIAGQTEQADEDKREVMNNQAPIEIVQIFPSTKVTPSSASSSSSLASNTSTPTASSTSTSPSVSPLAADQQNNTTSSTSIAIVSTQLPNVQLEAESLKTEECKITIGCPMEHSNPEQEVPQLIHPCDDSYRQSSSPPQLHSSLKKYKRGEQFVKEKRKVSFPKDSLLITGYLEPIDPWACVTVISAKELVDRYKKSCLKHSTKPLTVILDHLKELDLTLCQRVPLLSLRDLNLDQSSCEALEEVFKRVQYRCINASHAGLDDNSASVLFDMIEYYEAANELDISDNLMMTNKSWLSCINMIKKSQALNILIARGPGISEHHAMNLAKSLNGSALHTLKLEHCELSQRPLATLCNILRRNTVLRELSLANNQLTWEDAKSIADLLRSNYYIQLLDISNNNIGDRGVEYIVTALIEQSIYLKTMQETKSKAEFNFSDLSSSLNNIHNNKNYFPNTFGKASHLHQHRGKQICETAAPVKSAATTEIIAESALAPASAPVIVTPMTPPPTPALPIINTPPDEVFLITVSPTTGKHEIPASSQMVEDLKDEAPPMLDLTTSDTIQDLEQTEIISTNNDSGFHSSLSTEIEKNNNGNGNNAEVLTEKLLFEELAELDNPKSIVEGKGLTLISGELNEPFKQEIDATEQKAINDSAVDVSLPKDITANVEEDSGGGVDSVLLNIDVNTEDAKSPKKARLAKQDSVLSEFETCMPELMQMNVEPQLTEQQDKKPDPMEEDLQEACEDYDEDEVSLKIVEETLQVDRNINNNSKDRLITKDDTESTKPIKAENDDSAPATPLVPVKKDELQLYLEKSQRQEEETNNLDSSLHKTKEAVKDNKLGDIIPTIEGSKKESNPLKIVEVGTKDKPVSRSLESTCSSEFDSAFLSGDRPPVFPSERSFSSESLNSETSVDSNDSKSSLKIIESRFATRNGTLERQQSNANRFASHIDQPLSVPSGLQVLVLWNNEISRNSARHFADLIENTSTMEILNVGSNLLCNDFISTIKTSLKTNNSLTSVGLQGTHLSDNGAKAMAEVIEFGGNSTLQRIDLRNNNVLATGLDYLNEALKSNRNVTRIDLDDVPRRIVDNSLDVSPDYSRLLNNIRAQCERNKHPPETSEPISTSIKRVRSSVLSGRKISLTCTTSIRSAPNTSVGEKHHHHLLDPSKKGAGRLRSPLPSPIPSPVASPVPSPSRNRFQVTRVGEPAGISSSLTNISHTTSTSPSPSSTGSSPTLFFAANSRFRVVTVEEPPSLSSAPSSVSNQTTASGRVTTTTMSPSPLVTCSGHHLSRAPPTNSCSAPALSSFGTSPKSMSSPIVHSVATNTTSPLALTQQQLQMSQHFIPSGSVISSVSTTPKTKHTRLPSSSSVLNDSVISSTSIESPDLEVKKFMSSSAGIMQSGTGTIRPYSAAMDDSCCSSISSSIDSIDNAHFNNTSISSTDESFDLIISSPSSSSISIGSVSTAPLVKTLSSQQEDSTLITAPQQRSTQRSKIQQAGPTAIAVKDTLHISGANLVKTKNNSLSSLEMSTSSQESLYDVQDISSISSLSASSSLALGTNAKVSHSAVISENSNDNTLTSLQSLDKEKTVTIKSPDKPTRVRKTSWIASIGSYPKAADSTSSIVNSGGTSGTNTSTTTTTSTGYSPAIEKLLSIFSPSNLFSSKSSPPNSECGNVPSISMGATNVANKENISVPQLPSRKESPMGGLFQWTNKSNKDEEKVLKVNISPENTISSNQVLQASHQQPSPQLPAFNVQNIPSQIKAEMKENISPENTVTSKLIVNASSPQSSTVATVTSTVSLRPKVVFHLGDDYDDSEDDIDTLTSKFGGGGGGVTATSVSSNLGGDYHKSHHPHPSTSILGTSAGSTTTNSSGISISSNMAEGSPLPPETLQQHYTSHLGQLARDSLTTMFKNPSLTSQDSIRSMDSFTETSSTEQASSTTTTTTITSSSRSSSPKRHLHQNQLHHHFSQLHHQQQQHQQPHSQGSGNNTQTQ